MDARRRPARWRLSPDLRPLVVAMLWSAALLSVMGFFYLSHRHVQSLQLHAQIVGHSVTAAAVFDSQRDAQDLLGALRSVPDVATARLRRLDGSALAGYHRPGEAASVWQRLGRVHRLAVPVQANGQTVAWLEVQAQEGELWSTMAALMASLAAVMLVATTFTHLASRRMRAAVRSAEDRTRFLAHHDELTGLANRARFGLALSQAVDDAGQRGTPARLLCVDVDDFKQINDTRGHAAGDQALRDLAELLRQLVREGDLVARLGGDEFAVLLVGPHCDDACRRVTHALVDRLRQLSHAQSPFPLRVSIGGCRLPDDARTPDEAMQCADMALYEAKRAGKGVAVDYSLALGDLQRDRQRLQQDLHAAIHRGEILLVYQPVFDAAGRVDSLEALARWTHRTRGPIGPAEFIPIAEESGLIVELTLACMARAREDIDAWRAAGLQPPPVALNISSRLLLRDTDRTRFLAQLQALRLTPEEVEFELTESVLFDDLDNPDSILVRLQAMGYGLAIDDFGTGYSSLAYLRRLRCRKIKIDRLFIAGIATDRDNALMVESIIRVAHSLDMRVVAEGVEEAADGDRVVALGCDLLQGFGLCRPEPPDAVATRLAAAA
ncbi:putative bifunctional diguanylate cyclase/phosphodiesterase [Ideonella sp.]|uniref:putative bifunctional diguanylate cyclase/phosphodiesterase n=1 Tax=Ideonella sp. TaxID=1929293 RepID=UPI0035ADCE1C